MARLGNLGTQRRRARSDSNFSLVVVLIHHGTAAWMAVNRVALHEETL